MAILLSSRHSEHRQAGIARRPASARSGRSVGKLLELPRRRPSTSVATWGRIIADGQDYITTSWRIVTLTGLMIVLPVVGVNLLGDGLRDRPPGSKRLAESLVGRGNAQKAKA
ncbi:hypothetical protein ACFWAD_29625 [Rhodococcus sp. NPDC059969]|uniref:hypothetical protein n=1 Tax=Rhodococcus sp. NPDC059969 TaxID=3347018 RepID=UPI00366C2680